jgi:type I restriction enzyme R subunit
MANRLLDAIEPDMGDPPGRPYEEMLDEAVRPLAGNPDLRARLVEMQTRHEQAIDEVSVDTVMEAGFSAEGTERARATVRSFEAFIAEHKDEITALQIIYSIPRRDSAGLRLRAEQRSAPTFEQLKQLAEALVQPPRSWTTESLWRAYAQLERDRVRGAGARRVLTDLVSLVRHAVQLDDELVPYPERVQRRYVEWLRAQEDEGKTFTPEQRWWLDHIAAHIGVNLEVHAQDFNTGEFFNRGGQITAMRVFGTKLNDLLDELNQVLSE